MTRETPDSDGGIQAGDGNRQDPSAGVWTVWIDTMIGTLDCVNQICILNSMILNWLGNRIGGERRVRDTDAQPEDAAWRDRRMLPGGALFTHARKARGGDQVRGDAKERRGACRPKRSPNAR